VDALHGLQPRGRPTSGIGSGIGRQREDATHGVDDSSRIGTYILQMPGLRVCIDVDDLDDGLAFYTQALGLVPGQRHGDEWIELGGAPCPIDLVAKPPGTAPFPTGTRSLRAYERHWTPVHLDFTVEDLDAALHGAVAAGAKVERGIEEHPWGRIAVLADPFGHGFCLLEYKESGPA
jgi:predicted enzyme related to lactoylglutathione lyase